MKRKQLIVRKTGNDYSVGYWYRDTGDPIRDFKSLGSRRSEQEAKQLQIKLSVDHSDKYYL